MTSADKLVSQIDPARVMIVGYPGAGKTGCLACLVDAGFKLRVLDFDGNLAPLLRFTRPDALPNIDIVNFEDRLRAGPKVAEPVGLPTAFSDAFKMMDHWKYKDPESGEEIDLGRPSQDWGPDHIVFLDSLTSMGRAAKRRCLAMSNRTTLNARRQDWGTAMAEQEAFIERLTSTRNRHHVIVAAHLKMIGPKDVEQADDDLTKVLKERVAEIVPTRLFPSALGHALPPEIGGHFPTLLLVEPEYKPGGKVRRVIRTIPRPELDLKVPAPDVPPTLDISDGMVQIFNAITGGIDKCLETTKATPTS